LKLVDISFMVQYLIFAKKERRESREGRRKSRREGWKERERESLEESVFSNS
jgi:hypothetical protein